MGTTPPLAAMSEALLLVLVLVDVGVVVLLVVLLVVVLLMLLMVPLSIAVPCVTAPASSVYATFGVLIRPCLKPLTPSHAEKR